MNVKDAAERLEVSSSTIYALVAAGKLRCVRIGMKRGCIRILEEHIDEFIRTAGVEKPQAPVPVGRVKLRHLKVQ